MGRQVALADPLQLRQVEAAAHPAHQTGHGLLLASGTAPGLAGLHPLEGQPQQRREGFQTVQRRRVCTHRVEQQRANQERLVHA